MNAGERVYGYTGAGGLIQALAAGYFLYDLIICTVYIKIFGVGMLFHAISALWVFSFGFVSILTTIAFFLKKKKFRKSLLSLMLFSFLIISSFVIHIETIPHFLRPEFPSLRTLQPLPQYPLVPG